MAESTPKEMRKVALIFGGQSTEHEVSIQSAKNIFSAIDQQQNSVLLLYVSKQGKWFLLPDSSVLAQATVTDIPDLTIGSVPIGVIPGGGCHCFLDLDKKEIVSKVDVAFPIIHGNGGEDGSLQGLLHIANLPYVGPDFLGSAIAMDKEVSKRLMMSVGLSVAPYVLVRSHEIDTLDLELIVEKLGLPIFVKPARQGSSVGVSKVHEISELQAAIRNACQYGTKVILEEAIIGKEVECSVLGNEVPEASIPGEVIVSGADFYSYDAKYVSASAARTSIPASISKNQIEAVKTTALKAYKALDCEGMARVDMFVTANGGIYVNELNTLPGFTAVSMYPKMWEASGVSYRTLINRLIDLALSRKERDGNYCG